MGLQKVQMNREELYSYIINEIGDDYAIGIHGIDHYKFLGSDSEIEAKVEEIKKDACQNGLHIDSGRTLLGTVDFTDTEVETDEEFVNYYTYGDVKEYIVIALPQILKNSTGEEIFVGAPSKNHLYPKAGATQGYQLTSFSDAFLPDYLYPRSIVSPMFVLGTYTMGEDDEIVFESNPNHMAYRGDIVPDDFFEKRKQRILALSSEYGINHLLNTEVVPEKEFKTLHEMHMHAGEIINGNFRNLSENTRAICENRIQRVNQGKALIDPIYGIFPQIANETIRQLAEKYHNLDISSLMPESDIEECMPSKEYDFDDIIGIDDIWNERE